MLSAAIFSLLFLRSVLSVYELQDNSISSPFRSPFWTSYGSTIYHPQFISLTQDVQSSMGGIYNVKPIISRDWEIHIMFHVHSSDKTLFGDGFAFWYTQTPPSSGPAFGARDSFRGLGVFFDTYANQNGEHSHEHPYINAMINDGTKKYDHDRDGTLTELAGCSSNFRNREYTLAIIRYSNDQLSVSLKYHDTKDPVECFKVDGVRLPTGYYIGITAATGELSDNHDIYSVHTYDLEVVHPDQDNVDYSKIEPSANHEAPMRERVQDVPPIAKPTRWFWTIMRFAFLLSIVGVCGFFAYTYYRKRQRQLKRFY